MHTSFSTIDRIIIGTIWAINIYLITLFIKARKKIIDRISTSKSDSYLNKLKEITNDINDRLILATINNDINSVINILNSGADPRDKDSGGYTAIDFARGHDYSDIQYLLEKNIKNRPA